TERTTWAMTQLIRQEKVDIAVDLHEAELEYPVENTIVSHEKGQAVAAMTSMTLTAELFEVPLSMEFSPKALHGLSHREIGDHTDAMSLLVEVAEPMLDRIRGITDEYLLMTGRDEFVMKAGEHKLLYAPIDERGWPIDVRVGRHSSTFQKMLEFYSLTAVDRPVVISGVPGYTEVIENTLGTYMKNPEDAPAQNIYYD
ncbi:MAG: succinylglutamate desuccinylase, partial [Aminobacterium sp.]|nr:succinylglutamate desuccinylase [Aminobacterium sp.]